MKKTEKKKKVYRKTPNSYYYGLLSGLLAIFIVSPFFDYGILAGELLSIAMMITLFFSALIMSRSKRLLALTFLFGIPLIIAETIEPFTGINYQYNEVVSALFGVAFILLITSVMLYDMFTSTKVNGALIIGAVSLYLLLGLLWGFIYLSVDYFFPSSFNFTLHGDISIQDRIGHLMYYSMVTLTTLGYGDIAPLSAPARGMAAIQAAMGQLYLTVLVARLVGMHILDRTDSIRK